MTAYVDRTVTPPPGIDPKVAEWGKGQNDANSLHLLDLKRELLRGYFVGHWTPAVSFATPGDLSVSYTTQLGEYERRNRRVTVDGFITCTPTFTTASGNLRVTGIPHAASTSGMLWNGPTSIEGVTKTGYTQFMAQINANVNTALQFGASGSGKLFSTVQAADITSGVQLVLRFSITYRY